ncbi:MAG: hypothetical protein C5B55_13275 [Blastocatellia bacterium]|nr:MAG: hypothetical protein C5B55_13275 [Blastocatellia bacterium]
MDDGAPLDLPPTQRSNPVSQHPKSVLLFLLLGATLITILGSESARAKVPAEQMNTIIALKDGKDAVPFYQALEKSLKKRKTKIEDICPHSDHVAQRILEEYGAIFVASKKVLPPPLCIFTTEDQVKKFQNQAGVSMELWGSDEVELQPEAMKQLLKAREEAQKEGLDITPRDGAEAARRNYEESVRLWNSRFQPALDYWLAQGRLTSEQVNRLRVLPLLEQVAEVLELEKQGIYFSKDLSKSILYSIAAPGASQHIAMLAFDVNEFENPRIREIMQKHGWFQTVLSDLPHFTFLGLKEKDLPKHGLRSVEVNGQVFWIPNVAGSQHPGLAEQP